MQNVGIVCAFCAAAFFLSSSSSSSLYAVTAKPAHVQAASLQRSQLQRTPLSSTATYSTATKHLASSGAVVEFPAARTSQVASLSNLGVWTILSAFAAGATFLLRKANSQQDMESVYLQPYPLSMMGVSAEKIRSNSAELPADCTCHAGNCCDCHADGVCHCPAGCHTGHLCDCHNGKCCGRCGAATIAMASVTGVRAAAAVANVSEASGVCCSGASEMYSGKAAITDTHSFPSDCQCHTGNCCACDSHAHSPSECHRGGVCGCHSSGCCGRCGTTAMMALSGHKLPATTLMVQGSNSVATATAADVSVGMAAMSGVRVTSDACRCHTGDCRHIAGDARCPSGGGTACDCHRNGCCGHCGAVTNVAMAATTGERLLAVGVEGSSAHAPSSAIGSSERPTTVGGRPAAVGCRCFLGHCCTCAETVDCHHPADSGCGCTGAACQCHAGGCCGRC